MDGLGGPGSVLYRTHGYSAMAKARMAKLLHSQVRVILNDGRHLVGKLLSFDSHMNVVLLETQEFRRTRAGDRVQRALGLVMLRGDMIVSTIAEKSLVKKDRVETQPITMQL